MPEIDRQQASGLRVAFRADAAFARPEIYEALEARGVRYAIRPRFTIRAAGRVFRCEIDTGVNPDRNALCLV